MELETSVKVVLHFLKDQSQETWTDFIYHFNKRFSRLFSRIQVFYS